MVEKGSETNLWTVKDNALRDLLIYLVSGPFDGWLKFKFESSTGDASVDGGCL